MEARQGKHARVLRILRNRILRGVYEGKLPGQRELSAELGANVKSICVVLGQLEAMGLLRRTERRGTHVLVSANRPHDGANAYVRLVHKSYFDAEGKTDFWAAMIILGFQRRAQERGVRMVLEFADSVEGEVAQTVRESKAPGCVGSCLIGLPVEMRHALALAEASGPVVLVETPLEETVVPTVLFDNMEGGRLAAEHLVKLGHRRIAFVTRDPISTSQRERLAGAERFLRDIGMELSYRPTYHDNRVLSLGDLLGPADRPTGVILGNCRVSGFFTGLAAGRGLSVPRDLSVISFEDDRTYRCPAVTLIAAKQEDMGARAFDALLDEDLWANPRRVLLPVTLVDRGTTAAPPCVAAFAEQGAPPPVLS